MIDESMADSTPSGSRVVVAMSGGVDSSVAAYLLAKAGYQVMGVTMRLWSADDQDITSDHQGCCSIDDIEDAKRVCQTLGVPHYVLNVESEFREHVIGYFIEEYSRGRTPHPCIACNDRIKFDFLMRRAELWDARFVATGHYARVFQERPQSEPMLLKGVDASKDQSYVLYGLTTSLLGKILLPVGWYSKVEIRELAVEAGLHLATKKDSQEICFIPQGDYKEFLKKHREPQPGELVHVDGRILGQHRGIEFFTVGQRRGLGLMPTESTSASLFVTHIDAISNRVYVGLEQDLYRTEVMVDGVNYVGGVVPTRPIEITAKIRYNGTVARAELEAESTSFSENTATLRFFEPQRAVTPGQSAVFFDGDRVIGGGVVR